MKRGRIPSLRKKSYGQPQSASKIWSFDFKMKRTPSAFFALPKPRNTISFFAPLQEWSPTRKRFCGQTLIQPTNHFKAGSGGSLKAGPFEARHPKRVLDSR